MTEINLPHIIANKHVLFMDKKASSSSEIKPPSADELLNYYSKDQLRSHFMSLSLASKSTGFKPQVYMPEGEKEGVDPILKEGNLLTNVFNRLIRSSFYTLQSLDKNITTLEPSDEIKSIMEKHVLEYEKHMYNHDFHRISYVLDDIIREANKYWTKNIKNEDAKEQVVADALYACKVISILVHPIAPEGCEMFREYLNFGEELWNWDNIFAPLTTYFKENHSFKFLEPKIDFFSKLDHQY